MHSLTYATSKCLHYCYFFFEICLLDKLRMEINVYYDDNAGEARVARSGVVARCMTRCWACTTSTAPPRWTTRCSKWGWRTARTRRSASRVACTSSSLTSATSSLFRGCHPRPHHPRTRLATTRRSSNSHSRLWRFWSSSWLWYKSTVTKS